MNKRSKQISCPTIIVIRFSPGKKSDVKRLVPVSITLLDGQQISHQFILYHQIKDFLHIIG